MGFYPITVNKETSAEPWIYSEEDAAIYRGIVGNDGVMNVGRKCEATVLSNNQVRVASGVLFVGGHFGRIAYADYVDCDIANGQTGYNRNDLIAAKLVKSAVRQGIDTFTIEVIQGAASTGTAEDPAVTQGSFDDGDLIREMALYRVKIEGLSIVAVEQLFEVIPTIPELQAQVDEVNSNLGVTYYNTRHNVKVPSKTSTIVKTLIDLPAGTYIVCGGFEFTESFSDNVAMVISIPNHSNTYIVRGTGIDGGGLSCSCIITLTEKTTISLIANQSSSTIREVQNIYFDAVKLK